MNGLRRLKSRHIDEVNQSLTQNKAEPAKAGSAPEVLRKHEGKEKGRLSGGRLYPTSHVCLFSGQTLLPVVFTANTAVWRHFCEVTATLLA